jgi:hypothetical protein
LPCTAVRSCLPAQPAPKEGEEDEDGLPAAAGEPAGGLHLTAQFLYSQVQYFQTIDSELVAHLRRTQAALGEAKALLLELEEPFSMARPDAMDDMLRKAKEISGIFLTPLTSFMQLDEGDTRSESAASSASSTGGLRPISLGQLGQCIAQRALALGLFGAAVLFVFCMTFFYGDGVNPWITDPGEN